MLNAHLSFLATKMRSSERISPCKLYAWYRKALSPLINCVYECRCNSATYHRSLISPLALCFLKTSFCLNSMKFILYHFFLCNYLFLTKFFENLLSHFFFNDLLWWSSTRSYKNIFEHAIFSCKKSFHINNKLKKFYKKVHLGICKICEWKKTIFAYLLFSCKKTLWLKSN